METVINQRSEFLTLRNPFHQRFEDPIIIMSGFFSTPTNKFGMPQSAASRSSRRETTVNKILSRSKAQVVLTQSAPSTTRPPKGQPPPQQSSSPTPMDEDASNTLEENTSDDEQDTQQLPPLKQGPKKKRRRVEKTPEASSQRDITRLSTDESSISRGSPCPANGRSVTLKVWQDEREVVITV